jgi:hypothetical protein
MGGCWCEYYSSVRYTIVKWSRRICCRKGKGLIAKKPMDLCACESEKHEHGVIADVNTTLLSDTLKSIGLVESASKGLVVKKKHGPQAVCMRERGA